MGAARVKRGSAQAQRQPQQQPQQASTGIAKPQRPPTDFEQRLYEACKRIPKGKVTTYGTLAKVLSSSARAVGQGMRRNPFAPIVPCHRVIASDLRLGGFSGSWGEDTTNVRRKRSMLEAEGVVFNIKMQECKVALTSVVQLDELTKLCSGLGR